MYHNTGSSRGARLLHAARTDAAGLIACEVVFGIFIITSSGCLPGYGVGSQSQTKIDSDYSVQTTIAYLSTWIS